MRMKETNMQSWQKHNLTEEARAETQKQLMADSYPNQSE